MWFFVFILGVAAGLMDHDWPPAKALLMLAFIAILLLRQQRTNRLSVATGVGILAYLYTNVYLAVLFDGSLPVYLSGQDLLVQGRIEEVLRDSETQQQLRFQIDECVQPDQGRSLCDFSGQVVLNRYLKQLSGDSAPSFEPSHISGRALTGEHWQFVVRLYPVRGFSNPGQSRYRLQQLARGISARGYVRDESVSVKLDTAGAWSRRLNRWRSGFRTQADALGMPLVSTLLTGDSDHLSPEQWRLLQQTGTVHLVVVSGLHIGVLLAAGWLIFSLLSRVIALDRHWHRVILRVLPLLCLFPMLLIWPSGVAVSRALSMVLLVIVLRSLGVYLTSVRVLLLVVFLLLISQPLHLLRPGFYYSIWAVVLLLLLVSGGRHKGQFIRIQLVLTAGLMPLQSFWLSTPDLVSGLVNIIAIPLVSLLVLPLALLSTVLPFSFPEYLLAQLEPLFWQWLSFSLAFEWGVPAISAGLGCLFLLFALTWALPAVPGRMFVSLILIFGLLMVLSPFDGWRTADHDDFSVNIYDVGQGLAVSVRVDEKLLVYDTGPVFRSGFMPVSLVLPPLLRSTQQAIDLLVVSHDDNDHSGGLPVLAPFSRALLVGQEDRLTDTVRALVTDIDTCSAGQQWRWNNVRIEVLYPPEHDQPVVGQSDNARSCVLRIRSDTEEGKSILLTGDIGVQAERWLLASGQSLAADWLVASHHGSASGNSLAFLSAVNPEGVIYSSGFGNRYGHPSFKVQQRMAYLRRQRSEEGSTPVRRFREYSTADLGAIYLDALPEQKGWRLRSQRENIPLRWRWQKLN